jgi:tetratricopeptide (TPR) repeat protein
MDKETLMRLERGREYYANREYEKAEPYLLKVAETEKGFADVMNMLGVIYHDRGQVAQAREYFEKAMALNPRYTEAALNLAVTYNEQGLYDDARRVHEQATSLQADEKQIEPFARGKLSNMHSDLGQAYAELNIYDKAIAEYREALDLSPGFADVRTRLGQLLKDCGRLDDAQAELERVKRDRPGYVPARISLGATYFAKHDKAAARGEWNEVLALDPENRTARMYLRMVDQLLAQDEAAAAGMNLEVESPPPRAERASGEGGELDFSFDGERSSVAPAKLSEDERKGGKG